MYCTQCGNAISLSDKFCNKCGSEKRNGATHDPGDRQQLPKFGNPYTKWWGEIPEKKVFSSPYEWLNQKNTLLVFDNHLALMPGADKRNKIVNFLAATPLSFTLVGGPLVAGRSIMDKIKNTSEGFDSEIKYEIFSNGGFVWCRKNDAEIWEFQKKGFLGKAAPAFYAIFCPFVSILGNLPFLFPLTDTQESMTNPYKKIGCKIVVKNTNLSDKEITDTYYSVYKNFCYGQIGQ